MVLRLEPPYPNISASVNYNEKKADGAEGGGTSEHVEDPEERGHVVATRNVPEGSDLLQEFCRLRELNRRQQKRGRKMENESFHMSVNPGEEDRELSDAEVTAFIDEVMQRLGYGDQPYRIYRHNDIERGHYHVVTTRIGQDGKKINDSYEERRINRLMHELAPKYGFKVGLGTDGKKKATKDKTTNTTPSTSKFPPYSRDLDVPISEQFRRCHRAAVQWSFTTLEQYQAVMARRFNILAEIYDNRVCFRGYRLKVSEKAPMIFDEEINVNALEDIQRVIENTRMSEKKNQRERLERIARWASENSDSFLQFRQKMLQKGVYTVISWTSDGRPFGIIWLDMATHCAWKGSETDADLDWLKQTAEERNWKIGMDAEYERRDGEEEEWKSRRMDIRNKPKLRPVRKSAGRKRKDAQSASAAPSLASAFANGQDENARGHLGEGTDDIYEDEAKKIMSGKIM